MFTTNVVVDVGNNAVGIEVSAKFFPILANFNDALFFFCSPSIFPLRFDLTPSEFIVSDFIESVFICCDVGAGFKFWFSSLLLDVGDK